MPGKSHGQRSLTGYNPRGLKESDTTEQLTHMGYPMLNILKILILINVFRYCYTYYTEKAMATRSNTLAWQIPWMEEPGRLQSMGSLRVRHD